MTYCSGQKLGAGQPVVMPDAARASIPWNAQYEVDTSLNEEVAGAGLICSLYQMLTALNLRDRSVERP